MREKKLLVLTKSAIAWFLTLAVLIPIAVVVLASLKTKTEAAGMNLALPTSLYFENYLEAIVRGDVLRSFFNSLIISSISVIIGILVSSMAGFVLSRRQTRFSKAVYTYVFIGLMAPINYIATIKVFQILGIINTYTGITLLYVALGIPFAVFVFFGFMNTIPREMDEAAIIDGCGSVSLFFKVIFPLLKPVTMTILVLNFMGAWNDFISPLYILYSSEKWPLVMSIYNFFGMYFNEWNMISAIIILSILPITILYIVAQKYIVSGMTTGSIKL